MSDVNTTPLIDVLLVMLIVIDPDDGIAWNSVPLRGISALEAHFREESARDPQPQIQLRPSVLAKYDVVANVMASAQRNDVARMGFTNVAEYAH